MHRALPVLVLVGCIGCTSGADTSPTTNPGGGTSTVAPRTRDDAETATSTTADDNAAPSSTPVAADVEPCADGPVAVATTFVRAVQAKDQPAYVRCESASDPPALDRVGMLSSFGTLLIEEANAPQSGVSPGVVKVDVPAPPRPSPGRADQLAGVIITLTRSATGGYFVTNIEFYATT